jgi:hypothetical protein
LKDNLHVRVQNEVDPYVPDNALARRFRDWTGIKINASRSAARYLMVLVFR